MATDATPGCTFGMCRRPAELELVPTAGGDPRQVCGLHVTPAVTWGRPEPIEVSIQPLHVVAS